MNYEYKRLVTHDHSYVIKEQLNKFFDEDVVIDIPFDLEIERAVQRIINNGWKLVSVTEQGASYTYHFVKEKE